jgi:hypothetical protein
MATTTVHLELDDDWRVMLMSSNTGAHCIYWLSHEHPERGPEWRYTDLVRREGKLVCYHCSAVAPNAALGFVNLLEGNMLYDGGKQ